MKRGYWLASVVIVIAGAAALFLPTYFAKQGMDKLIASLPVGMDLTYGKADYSLFARTFTLDKVVLKVAEPALTIEADEIAVKNGNPWLEKAIEKAEADPTAATGATRIADAITVRSVHTAYRSIDFKNAFSRVDGPKLYLGELYGPLAPIKTDPSVLDSILGTSFRVLLQKAARQNLAVAFDKEDLQNTTITIDWAESGTQLVAQIADMKVDGYDRGSQQGTTIDNFTIGGTVSRNNAIEISIEKLAAGPCDYRDAFIKLRDGNAFETAFENFAGINETIDKVAVKRNGSDLLSIGTVTLDSSVKDGVNSVKSDVSKIIFSPPSTTQASIFSVLPELGYAPAVFNASVTYQQDSSTGLLSFSDTKLVLENGGTITVDGSMIGPTRQAPMQMKLASLTLTYLDSSLATHLLDYMAKKSGQSVDQIKAAYVQFLQAYENANAADPVISAGAEALKAFVANPHQLLLAVRPQQPIGRDDLAGMAPQTIGRTMGLSLTAQ